MKRAAAVQWMITAGICLYFLLFKYNSLTRTRWFSPDSMNYVDIARNIASGKGIVQSTLGYNQTYLFDQNSEIPTPFIAQPPLYPVTIALISRLGVSSADAALLISAAAYAIILLLAYILARDLYGEPVALLSLSALLIYAPLIEVSRFAWTESLSIVFILLSFWLLIRTRNQNKSRALARYCFLAGLTTGLAFSTRYALLPLVFVGMSFLAIEERESCAKLVALALYLLGAAIPIILVLGHNLLATGRLVPLSLPSDRSFQTNLSDTLFSTFGNYLYHSGETIQAIVAIAGLAILIIALVLRRRTRVLLEVFIHDRHYLLTAWIATFSAFIIYERTVSNFDHIDARIMVPAGVFLVILVVALFWHVFKPKVLNHPVLYGALMVIVVLALAREIRIALFQPQITDKVAIDQSDRLRLV